MGRKVWCDRCAAEIVLPPEHYTNDLRRTDGEFVVIVMANSSGHDLCAACLLDIARNGATVRDPAREPAAGVTVGLRDGQHEAADRAAEIQRLAKLQLNNGTASERSPWCSTEPASEPGAPTLYTTLQVLCSGAAGTVIPPGSHILDPAGNHYMNPEAGTIGADGTVSMQFFCTVPGPIPVPPSVAINQFVRGWDKVALTQPATAPAGG